MRGRTHCWQLLSSPEKMYVIPPEAVLECRGVCMCVQTFAEAERSQWACTEREWEEEKEQILNSLVGCGQDMDFTQDTEVHALGP